MLFFGGWMHACMPPPLRVVVEFSTDRSLSWELLSLPCPAPSWLPEAVCFPWEDYSILRQALLAGISLHFFSLMSTCYFYLYQQDPPCPFLQCSIYAAFQYLRAVLTPRFLLNWTTSYELVLQLSCPLYTFRMSPLSSL